MMEHKLIAIVQPAVLDIPHSAYDFSSAVESAFAENLYWVSDRPGPWSLSPKFETIRHEIEKINFFKSEKDRLTWIGTQAHLFSPCLLYPAGGFDLFSPYFLNPNVKDIISIAKEPFGSVEYLRKMLEFFYKHPYQSAFISTILSDPSKFDVWMDDYLDQSWTGLRAILRAKVLLASKFIALHYFELNNQGQPQFLRKESHDSLRSDHAVICFERGDGVQTRFWYIKQDILKSNLSVQRFIERLDFDLLIKASVQVFEVDNVQSNNVRDHLLQRAIDQNARVLMYSVLKTYTSTKDGSLKLKGSPHLNWILPPNELSLPRGFSFGYSNWEDDSNNLVFYGEAQQIHL